MLINETLRIFEKADKTLKFQLNPPATEERIVEWQEQCSGHFTSDYIDLYKFCDGQPESSPSIFFGLKLMPLEIASMRWSIYANDRNLLDWELGESVHKNKIRFNCYRKGWIPFAYQDSNNYIGIDLDPDTEGTVGQVINFGVDQEQKYVLGNSIPEFFDWCVEILKQGNFRVRDEDGELGIYFRNPPTEDFFYALPRLNRQ